MFSKIITAISFALLAIAAHATTISQFNPNQVNWPLASGSGAPSSTCQSVYAGGNTVGYGTPYTDTAGHNSYVCGPGGWHQYNTASGVSYLVQGTNVVLSGSGCPTACIGAVTVAATGGNTQGCFLGSGGLVGVFTNGSGVIESQPLCIGNGSISFTDPTSGTQLLLGINDNKFVDDTGSFVINVQKNGGTASPVTVIATSMPWSSTSNPSFSYGQNDGTSPIVAISGLTAGDSITLTYVSGTVNINPGGGAPSTDANGWLTVPPLAACIGGPTGQANCGGFGFTPTYYMGNSQIYPTAGLVASTGSAWRTPTFADVVALWASGSCTSGYLKFDGTCSTPSGGSATYYDSGYTFYIDSSGNTNARNNITGAVDYTNADAAIAIRSAIANLAAQNICAPLRFLSSANGSTSGIYNLNSLLTTSSLSYAIGIPSQAASNEYCLWTLEGDTAPDVRDQFSDPVQTAGVVLYVTPTAVASVSGSNAIENIVVSPGNAGVQNGLKIQNLTLRFPDNQRGSEAAVDTLYASNFTCEQSVADTNVAQSSLAFPVAGADGMIGMTTTLPNHEENYFHNCYAIGYDTSFLVPSEHTFMINTYSLNANYGFNVGSINSSGSARTNSYFDVGVINTVHGFTLGTYAIGGGQIDQLIEFEDASSGIWVPVYHEYEVNSGANYGRISQSRFILPSTGVTPLTNLFDGGGGTNFEIQNINGISGPAYTAPSFNGVPLTTTGAATLFLNKAGTYTAPISSAGNYNNIGSSVTWAGCTFASGQCVVATPGATITASSIPGSYLDLIWRCDLRGSNSSNFISALTTFNGDTGGDYDAQWLQGTGSAGSNAQNNTAGGASSIELFDVPAANATANYSGGGEMRIANYAGTSFFKHWTGNNGLFETGTMFVYDQEGWWRSTAALTSITETASSGNFVVGSSCAVWGRN